MRVLLVAAFAAFTALSGVAAADEREDLVRQVLDVGVTDTLATLGPQVSELARTLGSERANLTDEEKQKLEAGLTLTLRQAVTDMLTPVLNDQQRFSVEELRSIQAFVTSPAGRKWNGLAGQVDTKSPAMKAKIVAALLTNIDPAVLGKLVAARSVTPERQP